MKLGGKLSMSIFQSLHLGLNWVTTEIKEANHSKDTPHLHYYPKLRGITRVLDDTRNSAESLN